MHVPPWGARVARDAGDRVAVETPTAALTYRELDALANAGAAELDVAPGARVAIALPPGIDFVVALHACMRAGVVAVPIDLRAPDVVEQITGAAAVIDRPLCCIAAGPVSSAFDLDATALVLRTSGSTGVPKEVPLTYGNILWSAIGSAVALGLDPDERWLCTLPLVHVGGLCIVLRSAIYGTTAVIHERFDATVVADTLMGGGATLVSVVATTLTRLLDAGLQAPPALRCALAGGGPLAPALLRRAADAGVPVSQTYGTTEACSQVATQAPGMAGVDAGPPLFCTTVAIAPDGEILVSGPTLSPAAGKVLATGDLGELDDHGNVRVIARKSDIIITGGENVAPALVEATLLEHPCVLEAGVYGIADSQWGETVVAKVVLASTVAPGELERHCAQRLASFAVPKSIEVVSALPRTPAGKLRRGELAAASGLTEAR